MDATEAADALARARRGDAEAYRLLVERHSHAAFRLAFRLTGNEQDAEDVVQESFLKAYRQLARFNGRASFSTWLYRIVANCAVDLLRIRHARHDPRRQDPPEVLDANPTLVDRPRPDRLAESAEIGQRVSAALGSLTPLERAAFTLRHYEERSIDEIARTLGLGKSAAKHCVFRAVRKLRIALAPLAPANGSPCTTPKTS